MSQINQFYSTKVVAVIGGSSGIGLEIVNQLAGQGAVVIIGGRSPATVQGTLQRLTSIGHVVSFIKVDVQKPQQCQQFFEAILKLYQRLDYVFNCAGIIMAGEIRDYTLADIQRLLNTNVMGTTYCAFYAYHHMVRQGFGHIVNVASAAGLFPVPLLSVYSSSKFAVIGLSDAMRIEGKSLGVKVSVVTPGLVDTALYDTAVYSKADKDMAINLIRKNSSIISADDAATKILRGTQHNQAVIFTQVSSRLTGLLYRFMPGFYRFGAARLVSLYRSKYRSADID